MKRVIHSCVWVITYLILRPFFLFRKSKYFIDLKVDIPKSPIIMVLNHKMPLDQILFFTAMPMRLFFRVLPVRMYISRTVDHKSSTLGNWGYRLGVLSLIKILYDCVYVPDSGTSEEKIQPLIDSLESGYSVLIFPEGRIIKTNELGEFKKGISILAQKTNFPILLSAITYEKATFGEIAFGPVLGPDEYKKNTSPEFFKDKLNQTYRKLFEFV